MLKQDHLSVQSISELKLWIFKFFLQDYCIIHIGLKNHFENRNPTQVNSK